MFVIMSVTPLYFWIQFVLFLSFRVIPTMVISIFLWVVTSFLSSVLLNYQDSQPYVITGSIHWLNGFLFSLIGTFLSCMMLSSLPNVGLLDLRLSNSPLHFLYLVTVLSHHLPEIYVSVDLLDILSIDNRSRSPKFTTESTL